MEAQLMGLLRNRDASRGHVQSARGAGDIGLDEALKRRGRGGANARVVSEDEALHQSVVWAGTALRADLVSTLPLDVFRRFGSDQVEVQKPPVLVAPGGPYVDLAEWLYSSQMDLDRYGNAFGIIAERDAGNRPSRIDLVAAKTVTVRSRKGVVSYVIKGVTYDREEIWHERQYTLPGVAVGLSPIANAAWTLSVGMTAQEFALEWFTNGARMPGGHFYNTKKVLTDRQAEIIKERFKATIENRDVMVTGNDWEYKMLEAASSDAQFLQAMKGSNLDMARFIGVPGDLIDVPTDGQNVTYANVTQRNLQFLIMKLNPLLKRRENALSKLVAAPRFVKFNRGGILEMDPETSSNVLVRQVLAKLRAPSEARPLLDLPAEFTQAQLDEFATLWPKGTPSLSDPDKIGASK